MFTWDVGDPSHWTLCFVRLGTSRRVLPTSSEHHAPTVLNWLCLSVSCLLWTELPPSNKETFWFGSCQSWVLKPSPNFELAGNGIRTLLGKLTLQRQKTVLHLAL